MNVTLCHAKEELGHPQQVHAGEALGRTWTQIWECLCKIIILLSVIVESFPLIRTMFAIGQHCLSCVR